MNKEIHIKKFKFNFETYKNNLTTDEEIVKRLEASSNLSLCFLMVVDLTHNVNKYITVCDMSKRLQRHPDQARRYLEQLRQFKLIKRIQKDRKKTYVYFLDLDELKYEKFIPIAQRATGVEEHKENEK